MKGILATLVAVISAADASALQSERVKGTTIRADSPAARDIMNNAVRVNRRGERILNNEEDFELTSAYSFQFDTCVSLTTEPDDAGQIIFDATLEIYATKGEIVPQTSFVLFNVCKTKYCDYYEADDNLYMIDVGTYMSSIADFYVQRRKEYCTACKNSLQYCM
jgi:hypothetical protein